MRTKTYLKISFAISTAYALLAALMSYTFEALNLSVFVCGGAVWLASFVLCLGLLGMCGGIESH